MTPADVYFGRWEDTRRQNGKPALRPSTPSTPKRTRKNKVKVVRLTGSGILYQFRVSFRLFWGLSDRGETSFHYRPLDARLLEMPLAGRKIAVQKRRLHDYS